MASTRTTDAPGGMASGCEICHRDASLASIG